MVSAIFVFLFFWAPSVVRSWKFDNREISISPIFCFVHRVDPVAKKVWKRIAKKVFPICLPADGTSKVTEVANRASTASSNAAPSETQMMRSPFSNLLTTSLKLWLSKIHFFSFSFFSLLFLLFFDLITTHASFNTLIGLFKNKKCYQKIQLTKKTKKFLKKSFIFWYFFIIFLGETFNLPPVVESILM